NRTALAPGVPCLPDNRGSAWPRAGRGARAGPCRTGPDAATRPGRAATGLAVRGRHRSDAGSGHPAADRGRALPPPPPTPPPPTTPAPSPTPPSPATAAAPTATGYQPGGTTEPVPVSERNFGMDLIVLPVDHLLGDWYGLRTRLEDQGIIPSLTFVSNLAGNPVGGKRRGVTEADNLGFNVNFDLDKLYGLKGGFFFVSKSQPSRRNLYAID